ncbi:MAG: serine/threonine-protein kinase [Gemmatimonadota bacterium]|nr:serine/threonine-protein kinase [Gemmatimonadota bacterium]
MTLIASHSHRALEVLAPRYSDLTLVSEGRSGMVFTGHAGGPDGRAVAVKVAYPVNGSAHYSSAIARFRREAEIGARLAHPHILRTSPVEVLDGIEFYEMDAAGPIRLDQLITAAHPPGYARVLTVLQQLADALDYAHAHGVVHGALRPSTVLLDPTGQVLLKGFCLYTNETAPHPSLAPAAVGNPAYMAPEQWHDATVERRVDVYALGVLAYEMCTGHARVGYDRSGVPEIRPIELAPNHPLRADVPMHVSTAIRRATNRDLDVRYGSAGAFVTALTHPEEAQGHSLPTVVPPRNAKAHAPWMLLTLVLVVATAIFVGIPSSPRDELFALLLPSGRR